jgi:hypothetical protein
LDGEAVTAVELDDALKASRAKALAALGRAYRFREDEPDDELFAAVLSGMGLEDEVAVKWLLASWKVLRVKWLLASWKVLREEKADLAMCTSTPGLSRTPGSESRRTSTPHRACIASPSPTRRRSSHE